MTHEEFLRKLNIILETEPEEPGDPIYDYEDLLSEVQSLKDTYHYFEEKFTKQFNNDRMFRSKLVNALGIPDCFMYDDEKLIILAEEGRTQAYNNGK